MLKYIDVLIGLAVVLVVASMSVTVLTQAATNFWNSRGKALRKGLMDLLEQIHPGLTGEVARQIATAVLTHPMIREGGNSLGTVVHREELTKLLLELATADSTRLGGDAKAKLIQALKENGVDKPEQIIQNIRSAALRLEMTNPEMANNVRFNLAILQAASGDFVAKIHGWFDQTIDRVSARFTYGARWITLFNACIVALFLQLDTVVILNRLAVDDSLRNGMVEQAKALAGAGQNITAQTNEFITRNGLLFVPQSPGDWLAHWDWNHLPGIVISMLLLNLGAPFWFNILKNLLQLRSVIAQKDDAQRRERQGFQAPAAVAPADEKGNVAAVGSTSP